MIVLETDILKASQLGGSVVTVRSLLYFLCSSYSANTRLLFSFTIAATAAVAAIAAVSAAITVPAATIGLHVYSSSETG